MKERNRDGLFNLNVRPAASDKTIFQRDSAPARKAISFGQSGANIGLVAGQLIEAE